MLNEELHIGLQGVQVGEGLLVMREVWRVVPDVQQWRDRLPGDEVIAKTLVLRRRARLERMRETTLNRTESHDDVVPRTNRFWRSAAVLIGECVDAHVRMVALDVFGNRVDKADQ